MNCLLSRSILMFAAICLFSACATGTWPKNPQEFVQYYAKPTDSYTVDKSFSDVSKI